VKTIAELLREHPFTEGLAAEHLDLIAGCGKFERMAPGAYLFREGDAADTFYLIREGRVALDIHSPTGGGITLQTLRDGDIVGWSWLFPPYRYSFDARAVDSTRVVAFDGACLRGKAEADHELGYELMRRMARVFTDRLQATRLQLLDVYGRAEQV